MCPLLLQLIGVNCSDAAGTQKSVLTLMALANSSSSTGLQWDDILSSPWFNYKDTNGDMHQVWFDNPKSIGIKADLAKHNALRGMSMWLADYGNFLTHPGFSKEMWEAMELFFK
eukprot:TRINITY_DN1399_c0_g1_i2.p1 TRINITY_DN1399_c0_g1~~TRINITY_DN1399_c0_g1_i2.p1  ORF type:complete len:114 (+),score=23.39 TRINITY_DN1399_c0_g1_i2:49-390(+)